MSEDCNIPNKTFPRLMTKHQVKKYEKTAEYLIVRALTPC